MFVSGERGGGQSGFILDLKPHFRSVRQVMVKGRLGRQPWFQMGWGVGFIAGKWGDLWKTYEKEVGLLLRGDSLGKTCQVPIGKLTTWIFNKVEDLTSREENQIQAGILDEEILKKLNSSLAFGVDPQNTLLGGKNSKERFVRSRCGFGCCWREGGWSWSQAESCLVRTKSGVG